MIYLNVAEYGRIFYLTAAQDFWTNVTPAARCCAGIEELAGNHAEILLLISLLVLVECGNRFTKIC